jgi:hypothetical protein
LHDAPTEDIQDFFLRVGSKGCLTNVIKRLQQCIPRMQVVGLSTQLQAGLSALGDILQHHLHSLAFHIRERHRMAGETQPALRSIPLLQTDLLIVHRSTAQGSVKG